MIGTRETFDDLLDEVPERIRLRIIDLLESVVFQNERILDQSSASTSTSDLQDQIDDLEARVEALEP